MSSETQYIVIDCESTDGTLGIVRRSGGLVDILALEKDGRGYILINKVAALAVSRNAFCREGNDAGLQRSVKSDVSGKIG